MPDWWIDRIYAAIIIILLAVFVGYPIWKIAAGG